MASPSHLLPLRLGEGGGGQVSLYAYSHVSNLKVVVQTCCDCLCGRRNDGEESLCCTLAAVGELHLVGH